MNNRLLRIILIITPIAIVIAAAALLFVIILILNPEWELTRKFIYIRETVTATSMAAMVVATLFLAWATFSVINNDRQREERDRKERLLNEIIEWASNVAKSAISRQAIDVPELWKAKLEHKFHKSKGKYINVIVSSSFKELSDSFKDASIKLDEAIDFLERILSGKGGNVLSLKDYETAIADSVEKLLEEATKIKTREIS